MNGRTLLMLTLTAAAVTACGDDESTPSIDRAQVAGNYTLTTMTFDPEGSLPAADIKALFGTQIPAQLFLTATGTVQLIAQDPVSGTAITANGTFNTTATSVRITFDENGPFEDLLVPRSLELTWNAQAGTLTSSGAVEVSRDRLQALVQAYQNEQLFDPTPGDLQITFTRS